MRLLILLIALTSFFQKTIAQDVVFTFTNAQNTNDGTFDYYEADIQVESAAGFSLASGLLYFNYSTSAFGTNIHANGNIEVTYPTSYIVGSQFAGSVNKYRDFVTNDNTVSRFGFSFQNNLPASLIGTNVTSTATNLIHIKIRYQNVSQDPAICFESAPPLDDQFYAGDLAGGAAVQITNDNFDCSGAALPALPVELVTFRGAAHQGYIRLDWTTVVELNNAGFEIERLAADGAFDILGFVEGMGTKNSLTDYFFVDEKPNPGVNYYRLRQVDFDGQYEYSKVISVSFTNEIAAYNMYPNPTSTASVFIEVPQTNTVVTLIDNHGRIVLQANLQEGINELPLKNLIAGVYYVRFTNGPLVETKRLLIN